MEIPSQEDFENSFANVTNKKLKKKLKKEYKSVGNMSNNTRTKVVAMKSQGYIHSINLNRDSDLVLVIGDTTKLDSR